MIVNVARAALAACVFVIALCFVALGLVTLAYPRTLYPGQWAQIAPAEREWFRTQKAPNSGIPCCSEADGTYAEEDIRDGHYWTRFAWRYSPDGLKPEQEMHSDWMQVPDDVVIRTPNRHGAPVVWWVKDSQLRIRCYAPGSGL